MFKKPTYKDPPRYPKVTNPIEELVQANFRVTLKNIQKSAVKILKNTK